MSRFICFLFGHDYWEWHETNTVVAYWREMKQCVRCGTPAPSQDGER